MAKTFVVLVALSMTVRAAASPELAASRPNIIHVLADDMGWGDWSYNREYVQPGAGRPWKPNPPQTPNLDAMAAGNHSVLPPH